MTLSIIPMLRHHLMLVLLPALFLTAGGIGCVTVPTGPSPDPGEINYVADELRPFSEELAAARVGNRWGFVKRVEQRLKFVVDPIYVSVSDFSDGLAAVEIDQKTLPEGDPDFGYIRTTGNFAIRPRYWRAWAFHDGRARVRTLEGLVFIDATGRYFLDPANPILYTKARDFREGLAAVHIGDHWGFIGTNGVIAIDPQFNEVGDFSDGLAWFEVRDNLRGTWKRGYLDQSGRRIIPHQYDEAGDFHEGVARVKNGGRWSVIDNTGRVLVVSGQYAQLGDYHEGLARVRSGDRWGYIDRGGSVVIEPRFANISDFSDGLAWFQNEADGSYGFINRVGEIMIQPRFTEVRPFSDERAVVRSGTRWQVIDRNGTVLAE